MNQRPKHPLAGDWDKFVVLGQAIALDGRISNGAKALYWVLACYRNNQTGYSWPSMTTLVKSLGKSKDSIRRLREELETWGLLVEYQSNSGKIRYLLKPYSKAMNLTRRREQRGSQSRAPTKDDTEWTKTTPEPDHSRSTKRSWEYHQPGCECKDCERHRNTSCF